MNDIILDNTTKNIIAVIEFNKFTGGSKIQNFVATSVEQIREYYSFNGNYNTSIVESGDKTKIVIEELQYTDITIV